MGLDLVSEMVFHRLISVSVQNKLPEYFLVLMVLLFVELKEVLLAIEVVLQFLDLLLQVVFSVLPLKLFVLLNLRVDKKLSVESISLLLNFDNPFLQLSLFLSELVRYALDSSLLQINISVLVHRILFLACQRCQVFDQFLVDVRLLCQVL